MKTPRSVSADLDTQRDARLRYPLPATIYSALGPVPVLVVPDLKCGGEDVLGAWCPEERCIKLRAGMHPLTMLVTLYHEWAHLLFWDSGTGLDEATEERVCDAISTALVAREGRGP